ncbi:BTAD domain-containing putative transcriptional regulator [Rhizomonospora bruguierae]|uniref:BTAD domain-containing putative transcriptional regulator n=1 Tax=Rhizomonospora bruguierae TaxID=1581705 RepID=UPI001BCB26C5|nr:BTAD domain-containing putative transcriptional regulator [Micromonospora sp. NBRC 107566]
MDERGGPEQGIEVALLGPLRVSRGGVTAPLPGSRLRGLLARLAVVADRPVEAATLVDAVWPEKRPAAPANALQSLVSRLRRALGSAAAVEQVAGGYRLAVPVHSVDATRFEGLAERGRARLRAGDPGTASTVLAEAMALWRGPVAAELAAVAPAAAVRLAHARIGAAADLAEADLLLGRHAEVAGRLPALLAEEPLDERLAGLHMDALAGSGRQAEALAVYERIRRDLADGLGADPGSGLRERHLRLLRAGSEPAGARAGSASTPPPAGNLPAALTSFVGRDEDLARVEALLAAGRLVTVLGPGGAGKTRLAVEAAARLAGRFPDGTWLVDLAPVTEPNEVAAAIVSTLGVRGAGLFEQRPGRPVPGGRAALDVLLERLAHQETLLVLDNCEHLVAAAAEVATALLVRCPRLWVLATSREPLAVDGEALVPLASLDLPPPGADPAGAARSPAVRLFVERAAAVRPGFAVAPATVGDVVQVVRRLDGLPLALELAAARLRTLPLADLAAGLSDRFRLLAGGSRTALPRHRTLRAVIAWSWDLLGADERIVVERVCVLPAGVTPGSAAAVCAGTGIGAQRVPDLLAALVDRSLLHLAGEGPRYRMLETLREYGVERLAERGELTAVRELAARHVAGLVAAADPLLRSADQLPALSLLRAEYDNALAALRHHCDSGDGAAAVRLALDLSWYWFLLGQHTEAVYWLGEALATPGRPDPVTVDSARVMHRWNMLGAEPGGRVEGSDERRGMRDLVARLAALAPLPGVPGVLACALLYFSGQVTDAVRQMAIVAGGADPWLSALALLFRCRLAENEGDMARLRRDADRTLAGFRATGDRWGQTSILPLRAVVRQYDGDLDGALADLRTARALSREFGALDLADEIFLELRWADLHTRRGEPAEAEAALAAARARAGRAASPELIAMVDAVEAAIMIRRGLLDRAERLLYAVERRLDDNRTATFSGDHGRAIIGGVQAMLATARGDLATARSLLGGAYAAAVGARDMPLLALVATAAAELAAAEGRYRQAVLLLGAAARVRGAEDRTDPQVAGLIRRARAVLGPAGFADAHAAGWSLDPQAAVRRIDPARHGDGGTGAAGTAIAGDPPAAGDAPVAAQARRE